VHAPRASPPRRASASRTPFVPRGASAPRRALAPRWSTIAMAAWRAAVLVAPLTAGAWASPPPCGQPGFVGLASSARLTGAGDLRAVLLLTDAPVASLTVLPRVFVDGRSVDAGGPLRLVCGEEVAWSVPAERLGRARHAIHWTVLPWPPVAPAVAALDAEAALARYAERAPPGLFPWSGVEVLRPPAATPWRAPADADAAASSDRRGGLTDDAVTWLAGGDPERHPRLVRAPVGAARRFVLRYLPGERGAGRLLATCLLDDAQVAAFDGRPFAFVEALAGRPVVLEGAVVVPATGWHRLHCLLLPDAEGEPPLAWPRPLLAAYLWGDP